MSLEHDRPGAIARKKRDLTYTYRNKNGAGPDFVCLEQNNHKELG